MTGKSNKISAQWIRKVRNDVRAFLEETDFPDPGRMGERSLTFTSPEWLIMFIAILSVRLKIESYVQIHKTAVKYWDVIAEGLAVSIARPHDANPMPMAGFMAMVALPSHHINTLFWVALCG